MGTTSSTPPKPPSRDLDSVGEIGEMVRRFYGDVAQDDRLGPIFNDVAEVDWSEHLPKLTEFWCRALLGMGRYAGNPFHQHLLVHQKRAFAPADFHRWFQLFTETIELGWIGPNANRAIELATNVAQVHSKQLLGQAVELQRPTSTGEPTT